MASESAKQVAREVSEAIRNEQPVDLGKIIRKKGYSNSTSKSPQRVTETKSYQETIRPVVEQLEEERQAVIEDLKGKRGKAGYRDLIEAMDKITKNIQLLGGKPTESNKLEIEWLK